MVTVIIFIVEIMNKKKLITKKKKQSAEGEEKDPISSESTPLPITSEEDQGNIIILQMHFSSLTYSL